VTCYNKSNTIADCIQSVLEQDFQDYELIVVDDVSTDGSSEIINRFCSNPKVKMVKAFHEGISAAKNLGIKNSQGKMLLFLDGDTALNGNALSELSSSFIKNKASCIGGEVRAMNDNLLAKCIELTQNDVDRRLPFGTNVAYSRESVKEAAGGFSERMERGEDVDLFLRVEKLEFKCTIDSNVKAKTMHPDSFSSFFKQRFRWGMGFAQLAERHTEVFTPRIKFCFVFTSFALLSPLLALINEKLILIFPVLLGLDVLRFVPPAVRLSRKTKKKRYSPLITELRFVNSLAYLLGWLYWKTLELVGKRAKLKIFLPNSQPFSQETNS